MKKHLAVLISCALLVFEAAAQQMELDFEHGVPVTEAGVLLGNAFAGGLNAPQPGAFDLNGDTLIDMVVFEKNNNRLYTFIAVQADGAISYKHDPKYEILFPTINAWVIFADMDCDGDMDIFTSTSLGIRVFKNIAQVGAPPMFVLDANPLLTMGLSGNPVNIQVNPIGLPAITDIDGDGDLDIIVFDFAGVTVEYNKNVSIETDGICGLKFIKLTPCWGKFAEGSSCGEYSLGLNCRIAVDIEYNQLPDSPSDVQHLGSTLTVYDVTGNGVPDLLVGEVGCSKLYWLENTGTTESALVSAVRSDFPNPTNPIDIPVFPAAYIQDVNADFKLDVLAAPNFSSNESEGNVVDTRSSFWYYQQMGIPANPNFVLQTKRFLQETMIDVGEEASPCFLDVDGDGDLDLLIGNRGLPRGNNDFYGTLYLYLNTGTASIPAYTLASDDYLNLSQLKWRRIKPAAGDINNDGKADLLLLGNPQGAAAVTTVANLYLNTAPAGQSPVFTLQSTPFPISFGPYDHPVFTDVDGDSKIDMLLAKFDGRVFYYRNTGSMGSILYELEATNFGGLRATTFHRNPSVAVGDFDGDGSADLAHIAERGILRVAFNYRQQNISQFTWDSLFFENPYTAGRNNSLFGVGYFSLAAANLTDKLESDIWIGTTAGGVILLRNKSVVNLKAKIESNIRASIFPNPGSYTLNIMPEHGYKIVITSITGKVMTEKLAVAGKHLEIDTYSWPKGLYFIQLINDSSIKQVSKWIKE
jgi:hypothetical protein